MIILDFDLVYVLCYVHRSTVDTDPSPADQHLVLTYHSQFVFLFRRALSKASDNIFISSLFADVPLQRNISTRHLQKSPPGSHAAGYLSLCCRCLHIRTHCPPGQSDDQSVLFLLSYVTTSRNICMKCRRPIRTYTEGLVWGSKKELQEMLSSCRGTSAGSGSLPV